jgi:hypothetical protein
VTTPGSGKLADARERSHHGQIALPAKAFWSNIDLNRQATWGKSNPLAALHLRVVQVTKCGTSLT